MNQHHPVTDMYTLHLSAESEDAKQRVRIRASSPYNDAIKLFTTFDYTRWVHEHKQFVEEKLTVNPVHWYTEFKTRLHMHGRTASFPEFRGVIGALTRMIFQNTECYAWFKLHLQASLDQLVHKLLAIQIQGRYMWPYEATILCIERCLEILDEYYRSTRPGTFAAYYHNFRYRVYLTYILTAPDQVCFPTICVLHTQHFIKLRCVPVLLLGVAYRPLLADQYVNTPLDFWAHDVQHARRQIQETDRYYDVYIRNERYMTNRSPFDLTTKDEWYAEMHEFTKSVLVLLNDEMIPLQTRNLIRMIVFEITHEKAWPMTKFALCRNAQLKYDVFPIETMVVRDGVVTTEDQIFHDPTTLSNLRGKLRHGFFDTVNSPIKAILAERYRTSAHIVSAVNVLFDYLGFSKGRVSTQTLLALTKDLTNASEFASYGGEISTKDEPEGPVEYTEGEGGVIPDLAYFK